MLLSAAAVVVETERAVVNAGVRALGRKAVVVWKALAVTSWIATLHALIGRKHRVFVRLGSLCTSGDAGSEFYEEGIEEEERKR